MTAPRLPAADPAPGPTPALDPRLTVGQVVARLGLEPHPEGGYFRVAWRSGRVMASAHGPRVLAGAIHFLVPAGPATRWHRVHHEEEVWAWQAGGTLALRSGGFGPAPAWTTPALTDPAGTTLLGAGGTLLHALAEGVWQQAEVAAGDWVLALALTCPGYDDADFEMLP